ncbi:HAD-like domain-containing protein [Gaertneriomyces semiglobifer]|nr:HAD-like domain-containing protein [Gaertneriomyces semiglobifer]
MGRSLPCIKRETVKLIASDVDGTLLTSQHTLHPQTKSAIAHIRRHHPHLPFIICTGKPHAALSHIRSELDLHRFPSVHLNGCLVYGPHSEVLHEIVLEVDSVLRVLEQTIPRKAATFLYARDEVFEVVHDPKGRNGRSWIEVVRSYNEDAKPAPPGLLDEVKAGRVKVHKLGVMVPESDVTVMRSELDAFSPNHFRHTQALPFAIELLPISASKGAALAMLLSQLSLTPDDVIAFGDGENDLSMLKLVGYGVAVANAMENVKQEVRYLTAASDEGGVGIVLEQIFMGDTDDGEDLD